MIRFFYRYMNPPAKKGEAYKPTNPEQVANCITHGVWIIPSFIAAYKMHQNSQSFFHETVAMIYGASLIFLFSISTTFHLVSLNSDLCQLHYVFQKFDRIIIYIFIAACYMPWLLLQDNGGLGDDIAFVLCFGAIAGMVFSYFFHEKYKTMDTIAYLMIGVVPAIPLAYLVQVLILEVDKTRDSRTILRVILSPSFFIIAKNTF
ncbi:monocyte to macrophage differentiation factor-like isoform X2 [Rhopilema esculentum]|uniref:monocyte to macrophage differentiation factor-like isoform X2 n=1 Tax=Rhopilema esculentum TaxID=499914 RepID=UPI0031E4263F